MDLGKDGKSKMGRRGPEKDKSNKNAAADCMEKEVKLVMACIKMNGLLIVASEGRVKEIYRTDKNRHLVDDIKNQSRYKDLKIQGRNRAERIQHLCRNLTQDRTL